MTIRRALVCSYYPPEPDRDSGSRRLLDLIDLLIDEGWAVTFLAASGVPDQRRARSLEQRGVPTFDATRTPVEELMQDGQFGLALIAFWQVAERYLPVLRTVSPKTRVVVDSVDLQFLREARRRFSSATGKGLLNPGYADEMTGELNVYAAADMVFTVSTTEVETVRALLGAGTSIHSIPDIEELTKSPLSFDERRGVVFVGSFRHPPNVDALGHLWDSILPMVDPTVLAEHPITIVGDGLSAALRDRARSVPHLTMVGWVPSVVPYLERARVSVVPLRFGAGTKRKMIQALVLGTPTVCTSVGAEGLSLEPGRHVLVADDPSEFATSLTNLLTDPEMWQRLSVEGHRHIGKGHRRDAVRRSLVDALQELSQRSPKPPCLPDVDDEHYDGRIRYQHGQRILTSIRQVVRDAVRPGAIVAVVTEGDDELLEIGSSVTGWHYPQVSSGRPARTHPSHSAEAIEHLDELRARGAEYLLIPATSSWWLTHYRDWAAHLHAAHRLVTEDDGSLTLFEFATPDAEGAAAQTSVSEVLSPSEVAPAVRDLSVDVRGAPTAKLVAFYLPQFHPISENDEWWGEGFTEWVNVVAAPPLFDGHVQPHLPADLGFYDLRLAETRDEQAALARAHGIFAFCYYHYWFHGKRLLERPVNDMLSTGRPDMPFCLCWANEPWSRRWDGRPHDLLQPQTYSPQDDLEHIRSLLPALQDPRALTVDGKPVFIVYQAKDLPDPSRTVETWRTEADKAGLAGLHLLTVETGWDAGWDATTVGFDGKVLFQPQFTSLFTLPRLPGTERSSLRVYDYQQAWRLLAGPRPAGYPTYDTVFPSWDNTPRRGADGVVLHNSSPEAYGQWLTTAIERAQHRPEDERLVFINAWNEWGEGCHLEPDQRNGLAYLQETARALRRRMATPSFGNAS